MRTKMELPGMCFCTPRFSDSAIVSIRPIRASERSNLGDAKVYAWKEIVGVTMELGVSEETDDKISHTIKCVTTTTTVTKITLHETALSSDEAEKFYGWTTSDPLNAALAALNLNDDEWRVVMRALLEARLVINVPPEDFFLVRSGSTIFFPFRLDKRNCSRTVEAAKLINERLGLE